MTLEIYVIDTDCLSYLLSSKIGDKIFDNCKVIIPRIIKQDLSSNYQTKLKLINHNIIDLDEKQRKEASKLISKISGKKEIGANYFRMRMLSKIRNIGECEGAVICKTLKVDMVLFDREAISKIKIFFKNIQYCKVIPLSVFGVNMLKKFGNQRDIKIFKKEMWERFTIKLWV